MTVQDGNRSKGQRWRLILPCCTIALGLLFSQALMPKPVFAIRSVDPGMIDCTGVAAATFALVQAAVDDAIASSDPDVVICPGTYMEDVTVDDMGAMLNLNIRGALMDKSVVTIAGTGGPGPIINVVEASSVNLSNLTVDGLSGMTGMPPQGTAVGIQYGLVPGTIQNVTVQNIRDAAIPSLVQGIGINVVGQDLAAMMPTPATDVVIEILQCMVMNATRVGIRADGQGINVKVQQCQVVGPSSIAMDPALTAAPNGFQVSRGAKGMSTFSSYADFKSPAPTSGAGSGIVFLCPAVNGGGVAVAQQNIVTNSDIGVSLIDSDGVRVASNIIIDPEIGITLQSQGMLFADPMCFPPLVPPQNSQIVSNLILDATEAGMQSIGLNPNGFTPQDSNFEDNSIFTDVMIAMAPIAVSDGQRHNFLQNTIFGGPTSQIVDQTTAAPGSVGTAGTGNTYSNFCFGIIDTPFCNALTNVTSKTGAMQLNLYPASPFMN